MNNRFALVGLCWLALSFVNLASAQQVPVTGAESPAAIEETLATVTGEQEADALLPQEPARADAVEPDAPQPQEPARADAVEPDAPQPQEPARADAAEPDVLPQGLLADPHDLSPWGMYQAADWVVKSVMILLLIASLLSWTVCFYKGLQLAVARQQSLRLLAQVAVATCFEEARSQVATKPALARWLAQFWPAAAADGWAMIQATALELKLSDRNRDDASGLKERVGARLERVQVSAVAAMNKGTGILATIGAVAPFVGLFGTVWGIMNSFIGIARSQTTNLAVVAPGIAEALLATALGLVAAVPAVIIYNHFARSIGAYRNSLGDIATALLILVSRDLGYLQTGRPEVRQQPVTAG